jgi:DNA-binding CsgD family transcriptional regulator
MRLARAAIEAHRFDIASVVLTEAERESATSREIAAIAALRSLLAAEADDIGEADRQARAALGLPDADPEVTCEALYVLARVLRAGEIEQAIEPLERAVALAELHSLAHWRLRAMLELAMVDRHTSGRVDRCLELRDLALETGAVSTAVVALLCLGSFSRARGGDWSLADGRAAVWAAYHLADRFNLADARSTALIIRSAEEAVAGDRMAFEATLHELGEVRFRDTRADYPSPDTFRGMWGLFQDDLDLARRTYREAAGWINASPDRRSNPERGFDVLLRVIDGHGNESDVEGLRAAGLGAWTNRGLAHYADAVCLGRRGPSAEAVAAVDRARADLRGHALVDYAGLRLVAGAAIRDRWGAPAEWLREAREFFEEEGMTAMMRACNRLLRESGEAVPRRGRGDAEVPLELRRLGVTSREMDVLLQLRDGSTNAEIAERLCMSRRTVETHVTRLLAKTGSRSRVELAGVSTT